MLKILLFLSTIVFVKSSCITYTLSGFGDFDGENFKVTSSYIQQDNTILFKYSGCDWIVKNLYSDFPYYLHEECEYPYYIGELSWDKYVSDGNSTKVSSKVVCSEEELSKIPVEVFLFIILIGAFGLFVWGLLFCAICKK